ncbi:MAG: hypothetical protein CMM47_08045 [Rhodospirillaceae bacterium]|nr:hypothetical protein [Rhodospirillaceae bacterium]
MTSHRYPINALLGDYLRGGIGFVVSVSLFAISDILTVIQYIIGAAGIIFGGYVIRTVVRHWTALEVSEDGMLANGPFGKALRWNDVTAVKLRYFSTQRDRSKGWFQLTIKGSTGSISVDSTLEGFEVLLKSCAQSVMRNGLELSEATTENFAAAGYPIGAGSAKSSLTERELGPE